MENNLVIEHQEPKSPLSMDPKKFAFWIFLGTVVMLFMSLTSAYLVKRSDGEWLLFRLPPVLYLTTFVIAASSLVLQLGYRYSERKNVFRMSLLVTMALGIVFLAGQFYAWKDLVQHNVYLVGNAAGSFVYVITGLHGLHIISAVIVLAFMLFSHRNSNPKEIRSFKLGLVYWHFLGILWIYLLIFFILFR